jgi:hypothetical protein
MEDKLKNTMLPTIKIEPDLAAQYRFLETTSFPELTFKSTPSSSL